MNQSNNPRRTADLTIELRPAAVFGKRDSASDYTWLRGREELPAELAPVCELLATFSDVPVALAAELDGACWLARSFRSGMDKVYRPVVTIEVVRSLEPSRLSPEEQLRLISTSFGWDSSSHPEPFRVRVRPVQIDPSPLDAELAARSRLGLPLSVTPQEAVGLVRQRPWRYAGICLARKLPEVPARWQRDLASYLCVDFSRPALTGEEEAAVESVLERPPSQEEWTALAGLPPAEVFRALSWARTGASTGEPFAPDDPLLPWLVAFLAGSHRPGPALLAAVLRAVQPPRIPGALLSDIAPDLSSEARAGLAAMLTGEDLPVSDGVADELARGGYLDLLDGDSFRRWAGWAHGSSHVARSARQFLERRGAKPEEACFVLDLAAEEPSSRDDEAAGVSLVRAVEVAADLGLAVPRRRLLGWLRKIRSFVELDIFAQVARHYDEWSRALGRLAKSGEPPANPRTLNVEEMALTLAARRRAGEPWSLEEALGALLRQGRQRDAEALLNAASEQDLAPSAPVLAVLRARLGLGPPAPPPPWEELQKLVEHGLARPQDVVPAVEGDLAACARLWPETLPLARLLTQGQTAFPEPPELPEPWRPSIRAAVRPGLARRWIGALADADRGHLRTWIVDLHGLAGSGLAALWGEGDLPDDRATFRRAVPWIGSLLAPEPRGVRLQALSTVMQSRLLQDDEDLAAGVVSGLCDGDGHRAQDLAIHALCGRGCLPCLDGAPADLIVVLAPALKPAALATALVQSDGIPVSEEAILADALVARIRQSPAPCPPDGYLRRQLERHPLLWVRLGELPGWEELAPGEEERKRLLVRLLSHLRLSPDVLREAMESKNIEETDLQRDAAP